MLWFRIEWASCSILFIDNKWKREEKRRTSSSNLLNTVLRQKLRILNPRHPLLICFSLCLICYTQLIIIIQKAPRWVNTQIIIIIQNDHHSKSTTMSQYTNNHHHPKCRNQYVKIQYWLLFTQLGYIIMRFYHHQINCLQ